MPVHPDAIREFMSRTWGFAPDEIENETPLFTSGLLDSLSMVDIVAFIEEVTSVEVDMSALSLDDLDSIDGILAYISNRIGEG